ncbi:hypothetical protein V6N11_032771 [Hibiscus sabdariffa]|uniref:Uncharacterized protein n=1 Tax=Hibiscus sabdariffa TaxID=183260 RepID=A0ABR2T2E4_9ROSI
MFSSHIGDQFANQVGSISGFGMKYGLGTYPSGKTKSGSFLLENQKHHGPNQQQHHCLIRDYRVIPGCR